MIGRNGSVGVRPSRTAGGGTTPSGRSAGVAEAAVQAWHMAQAETREVEDSEAGSSEHPSRQTNLSLVMVITKRQVSTRTRTRRTVSV